MYCEQCGAKNEDGTKFCTSCGASMGGNGGNVTEAALPQKNKGGAAKKAVAAILSVAVVCGAGVAGYRLVSGKLNSGKGGRENHPVVYIKDSGLYLRNTNKKESYTLTNKTGYYDPGTGDGYSYGLVQVSEDGKRIFFADAMDEGRFRLYYRNTKQKKPRGKDADDKGIRLASGVTDFKIAPNGEFVIYIKNDRLYISNLKEERSISSETQEYYLSSDAKKILYKKSDGDLYLSGVGKKDKPEKIDSEVSGIVSNPFEYSKIYYMKDESLYVKEYGKDKVKIASDVSNASMIGDNCFFTKEVTSEKKFKDLFNDDCADSDAQITEPSYSDFQTTDEDGYSQTDYDAYNEADDKYDEKCGRDDVREYYSENPEEIKTYTLYMADKKDAKKLEEGLLNGYIYDRIIEKQSDDGGKITLSEVTGLSDARSKLSDLKDNIETETALLKSDGTIIPIDSDFADDAKNITVSEDEKYLYCIEDVNSDYCGTLNRYSVSSSGIGSKKKIHDEASGYMLEDGAIIIYSDDNFGIFVNGKYTSLADSYSGMHSYIDGVLYYYDQYSSSGEIGNLMRFKNGKKEQIDIDVHDFVIHGTKDCYYLKDYSIKSSRGELYRRSGKKSKLIDSDVSYIVY